MNTYEKGNLSEAVLTARLLEYGYKVLIPVGSCSRYDLVIESDYGFQKIQVKTACIYKERIMFNTCSNNKGYKRKSYHGEIDLFGVYCKELDECYLIPVEKTGKSAMSLRINNSKNNQRKGINLKDDFLLKR